MKNGEQRNELEQIAAFWRWKRKHPAYLLWWFESISYPHLQEAYSTLVLFFTGR